MTRIFRTYISVCLVAIAMLCQAVSTFAADGAKLAWSFAKGTLHLDGNYDAPTAAEYEWHSFRNEIHRVEIGKKVTHIGSRAFVNCPNLESIVVHKKNTTYSSPEGSNVIIETREAKLVAGCKNSVIPVSGVSTIGGFAFCGAKELKSIILPESVTTLEECAFFRCESLAEVKIEGIIRSIGNCAFDRCAALRSLTFRTGLTSIGNYVFRGCSSLERLTIPPTVRHIGIYAFQNCSSLRQFIFPASLEDDTLGEALFMDCSSITQIVVPPTIRAIGKNAFSGCSAMQSLVIPESVTEIGPFAFDRCTALTHLTLGSPIPLGTIWTTFIPYSSKMTVVIPRGSKESYTPFWGDNWKLQESR